MEDSAAVSPSPSALPHFDLPPVIEVVCGVQFEAPAGFGSVHFGRFHEMVRDEYPDVEELAPLVEAFEGPLGVQAHGQITFELPPLRRLFFKATNGNFLLQVQPTRFLTNWRRVRTTDEYPRFSAAFERFTSGWNAFLGMLGKNGIAAPRINQYELTYINHLGQPGDTFPAAFPKYLRFAPWGAGPDALLRDPKAGMFRLTYPLGSTTGSLHVTVNHGVKAENQQPVMVIDMTARGPAAPDGSDMKSWFDLGHEYIVRGFTETTSDEAHRSWRRKQ